MSTECQAHGWMSSRDDAVCPDCRRGHNELAKLRADLARGETENAKMRALLGRAKPEIEAHRRWVEHEAPDDERGYRLLSTLLYDINAALSSEGK